MDREHIAQLIHQGIEVTGGSKALAENVVESNVEAQGPSCEGGRSLNLN